MSQKPEFCSGCPINNFTEGYVPPLTVANSSELIVGEAAGADEIEIGKPFVGGAGRWLSSLLQFAKQPRDKFNIINTIGCKLPGNIYPSSSEWKYTDRATAKEAISYCKQHHLQPFIDSKDWNRVFAVGAHALESLVPGRTGIQTWRGSPLPLQNKHDRPRVIPTLHPAFLMRGSNMFPIVANDFRKSCNLPPENYRLYATEQDLRNFADNHRSFVFDFEWDTWGNITLCGLTAEHYQALVFAWVEPYISIAKQIFENATDLYGHNIINADTVYFRRWGWDIKAKLWDTMLMQHLIHPSYRHGLAFVSSIFTNRVYWKADGEEDQELEDGQLVPRAQWKTWNTPYAIPIKLGGYGGCQSDDEAFRLYNARDCAANFDIIEPINHALDRYNLKSVYWNVSRPIALICRDTAERGLKIDQQRLDKLAVEIDADIARLEQELPDGLRPYEEEVSCNIVAPPDTYKPATKKCKGKKSAGTQHDTVIIEFTKPGIINCPVCNTEVSAPVMKPLKVIKGTRSETIVPWNSTDQIIAYAKSQDLKMVYNPKTKQLSADKTARKSWGKHESAFVTVDKLKKLSTLRQTFLKDSLRSIDRMFYQLQVHGTSEGRLSCKGMRSGIDLNIQQLNKKVKAIFVPDTPDDCFLSFDIGQGENILTTWLAKDWARWERIKTPGYDEHADLANKIFNVDCSKDGPNDALRQIGKKINHLKNYGGSANKIHEVLVAEGYNIYTLKDCKEFVSVWRELNAGTAKWQDETIELAARQGFLRNKFGRMCWFNTSDLGAKALAFLPASTLADCVLRMMISCFNSVFVEEIHNLGLKRAIDLPKGWDLRWQIHDDLGFHGPFDTINEAASLIKNVMTQPWIELDGLEFEIDAKYSTTSWGEMKSLVIV